jgi:transcriptional regulator with XRE-family HTH domain
MSDVKPPSTSREARQVLVLTQEGLAELLGVARPTIAKWESDGDNHLPRWAQKALRVQVGIDRLRRELRGELEGEEGE